MDGFTLVDAGVAVIVLVSAILAYSRGFVREVLAILGWIAAAVVAFYAAPQVEPLIKEIPIINEFLAESCELAIIAAFVAVFAVALIVLSIFVPLFAGAVQRSALGGIDQGLGFLFGIARGALLVIVALIVYDRVALGDPIPMVDDSRSALIFSQIQDTLAEQIPDEVPTWIVDRYEELVGDCGIPATAPAAVTPAEAPADNS